MGKERALAALATAPLLQTSTGEGENESERKEGWKKDMATDKEDQAEESECR